MENVVSNQETVQSDRAAQAKWYVIHTYSTYELAVRDNILKMVENKGRFEEEIPHLCFHQDDL